MPGHSHIQHHLEAGRCIADGIPKCPVASHSSARLVQIADPPVVSDHADPCAAYRADPEANRGVVRGIPISDPGAALQGLPSVRVSRRNGGRQPGVGSAGTRERGARHRKQHHERCHEHRSQRELGSPRGSLYPPHSHGQRWYRHSMLDGITVSDFCLGVSEPSDRRRHRGGGESVRPRC